MSVCPEVESLLAAAASYEASDLILHEGSPPRIRIAGRLNQLEGTPLDAGVLESLWTSAGIPPETRDYDTTVVSAAGARFRANLFVNLGRRGAVLRRIRSEAPKLETLGLPTGLLADWLGRDEGIILVVGPTGSGKSTTLAACLDWLNDHESCHVVTVEDPVEFIFENRMCVFTQREVGLDTASFAEGLRRALRQDPDVILVGEIRDATTAITALQAAETGHLVLATLHAGSAPEAVERLQSLFPPESREVAAKVLAAELAGVICQRLLAGPDGGVVLAAEYFTNVGSTRKLIQEMKVAELADFIARGDGSSGQSLLQSLAALVRAGRIAEDAALAAAPNPQQLTQLIRGIATGGFSARR